MQKISPKSFKSLRHLRLVTSLAAVWLLCGYFSAAQVAVVVSPPPYFYAATSSGNPLAFGCVYTYKSGTVTPLETYTDSGGGTQNQNPIVLTAGGTANIWLKAGNAYTFKIYSSGGLNCVSGTLQRSINGIGGGTTLNTTNVSFSATPVFTVVAQNQLFTITLTGNASAQPLTAVGILAPAYITFQITQDNVGGHTFSWPANTIGGAPIGLAANQVTTQHFVWNGITATAVGPATIGNGPAISTGTISDSGDLLVSGLISGGSTLTIAGIGTFGGALTSPNLFSTCTPTASSGFLRLCKTDQINWRNNANSGDLGFALDASDRLVASFSGGLVISGTTPNLYLGGLTASFPFLKRNATAINVRLADDSADAPFSTGNLTINGVTISGTPSAAGQAIISTSTSAATWSAPVSVQAFSSTTCTLCPVAFGNASTTIITKTLTMPSTGCPCRVHASYNLYLTTGNSGTDVSMVTDGSVNFAAGNSETTGAVNGGASYGIGGSGFSPATYANSATPTFTIKAASSHAGNTTAQSAPGTDITPAWDASTLDLTVFPSN